MDSIGAERWLSYAELAELRGISRKAAMRLTQRHRWRRQPGNDGQTRVLVPADLERRQTPRQTPPPDPSAVAVMAEMLAALKTAHAAEVAALKDRADRAEDAARKAQEAAELLRQAEEARRARGRLRRAWDGWRGR